MLVSLNCFFGQHQVSPLALCTVPFLDRQATWHVRYEPIPWWTNGYTLTGTALLIGLAVGLAWVALVFVWNRAFEASA
jgi:hypothetical protein